MCVQCQYTQADAKMLKDIENKIVNFKIAIDKTHLS